MSSVEESKMSFGGVSRLHRLASQRSFVFLPVGQNGMQVHAGSLHHILKPLEVSNSIKTISHTSSNPLTGTTAYNIAVPEVFYDGNFDIKAFETTLNGFALRVPSAKCGQLMKVCKGKNLLQYIERVRNVCDDVACIQVPYVTDNLPQNKTFKRILLNMDVLQGDTCAEVAANLPEEVKTLLTDDIELIEQEMKLSYDYFTAEQVLTALLPESIVKPSSLSIIGHIGHQNLRDEQLPYKHIIGRVLIDKNAVLRTVVNKVGQIDNVFRNFQAEVLYGDTSLVTTVKECNLSFTFDFSQVYWNSRLHTEHARVVELLRKSKLLFPTPIYTTKYMENKKLVTKQLTSPPFVLDLFGGIGPFALPAADNGCFVWSNDINPRSALYMYRNTQSNKLKAGAYNSCGREMQQGVVKRQLAQVAVRMEYFAKKGVHFEFKHNITGRVYNWKGDLLHTDQPTSDNVEKVEMYCNGVLITNNEWEKEPIFYSSSFSNTSEVCLKLGEKACHAPWFEHTIMNLPASATTFLDMYVGIYGVTDLQKLAPLPPMINEAHADEIASTDITDVRHVYTYFNTQHKTAMHTAAHKHAEKLGMSTFYNDVVTYEENNHTVPGWYTLLAAGMKPFVVHCYLFARSDTSYYTEAIDMCEKEIGYSLVEKTILPALEHTWGVEGAEVTKNNSTLPKQYDGQWVAQLLKKDGIYVQYVRNVAPLKEMMCVEMVLTKDILTDTNNTQQTDISEPEPKRKRSE